jgi:hypothetical protein
MRRELGKSPVVVANLDEAFAERYEAPPQGPWCVHFSWRK